MSAVSDLFQLVQFAPPFIAYRALCLVEMMRASNDIVPALAAIALDTSESIFRRRIALRAIAEAQNNSYLPDFAQFARFTQYDWKETAKNLGFNDVVRLCAHHPCNTTWILADAEQKSRETYRSALLAAAQTTVAMEAPLNDDLLSRIVTLLTVYPQFFEFDWLGILHSGGEAANVWLLEHMDEVIYLCLVNPVGRVITLLDSWRELKPTLLKNCPALQAEIEQWEQEEQQRLAQSAQRQLENATHLKSETWRNLYKVYLDAKTNEEAFQRLTREAISGTNVPVRAFCAYLLGLLQHHYPEATDVLCYLLEIPDNWGAQGSRSPVRKEVLSALRHTPTPRVWEALVNGYFINPVGDLDSRYHNAVRHVTDILDGRKLQAVVEGEYSDTIPFHEIDSLWMRDLSEAKFYLPQK